MAKNKTLKVLSTGTVAGMIAAAVLSSQAFAAVNAYSVKIGDDVLKYDKAALTESFLASKAGDAAPLYEDFTAKLAQAGGFYAFNDAKTGKFVSYNDIQAKFLEAKAAGEAFVVDNYTESATAQVIEVPTAKKVVVKDGKVVVEADGTTTPSTGVVSVSAINWAPSQSVATTQQLFQAGTVSLKAGDADATITGIKLKRSGLSSDTDIRGISIWDGAKRVNLPVIFANGVADITFTSPVTITKNTSKDLAIKVDFNVATAGSQVLFSIAGASDIKSSNSTVSGLAASTSGTYTASNVTLGTLTVDRAPGSPSVALDPNTNNVLLAKYRVTAANEIIKLKRLTLTQNGSAAATDLANFKLYKDGVQVGSTVQMDGRTVTFVFDQTIEIANGAFIDLDLKADIKAGSGRTVQFNIDNSIDIEGQGTTYGTAVTGIAGATTTPFPVEGTAAALNINSGSFLVSRDASSPSAGNISPVVSQQSFGAFKVEAVGEAIQLRTINLTAVATDDTNGYTSVVSDLRNVKVMVGDQIIYQATNAFTNATTGAAQPVTGSVTLSNPITINPGTPVVIKVVADIPQTIGADAGDMYRVDLTANALSGLGLVSGNTIASANPLIATNNLTINNLTVTAALSPSIGNGNIFANETDHKFMAVNLSHNLSDSVLVTQIDVLGVAAEVAGAHPAAMSDITNLRLVNANGEVVSNVISTGGANNVFTLTNPIELAKSQVVALTLVGNVSSAIDGADTYTFGVAGATSVARTKTSGTSVTLGGFAATAIAGRVSTQASNAPTIVATSITSLNLDNSNVVRGAKDVTIGAFKIRETGNIQGAYITSLDITPTLTTLTTSKVTNIRVIDVTSGEVLGTIPNFTASGTADRIELSKEIYLKDSSKEIKVLADISSTAQLNGTIVLSLGDSAAAGANQELAFRGASTGLTGTYNSAAVALASSTFRAVPTDVKVEKVAITTTSLDLSDGFTGSEVGKWKITNNGPEAINIGDLNFTSTGFAATQGVTLFNGETGAVLGEEIINPVAASTWAHDAAGDFGTDTLTINATGAVLESGKSIVISARITDTTGAAAGDMYAMQLNAAGSTYVINGIGSLGTAGDEVQLSSGNTNADPIFVKP